jgi:hypothetical protein
VTVKGALKIRAMSSKSFTGLATARLTSPPLQKLPNLITRLHTARSSRGTTLMILNRVKRREVKGSETWNVKKKELRYVFLGLISSYNKKT